MQPTSLELAKIEHINFDIFQPVKVERRINSFDQEQLEVTTFCILQVIYIAGMQFVKVKGFAIVIEKVINKPDFIKLL